MKNFIQDGEVISVDAPYDVTSGGGCLVGSIFGIATTTVTSGNPVELKRRGVVKHAKTSAQAWTVGAKIYWDDTNKVLTTTASGNTLVGVAVSAAANPSAEGTALLDGAAR